MRRCTIQFEQLGRRLGCYVPTAISINFQDTLDATVYHSYVVTSISSNFEDALDVTFKQLLGHYGCYVVRSTSSNLEDTLDATFELSCHSISRMLWMLRGNIHFK